MRFLRRTNKTLGKDEHGDDGTTESPSPTVSTPEQPVTAPEMRQLGSTKFLNLHEQQEQCRSKNRFRAFRTRLSSTMKGRNDAYKSMGLDETTIFSSHNTYIWTACKIGDLNYVRQIIRSCPDQLHLQLQGRTPLYHACHCGHIQIVKELLMAGCTDRDGTCYQSALTPEIRTLLRQYKIVDEQINGMVHTNLPIPSAPRSSAATLSPPKYLAPSVSSPLDSQFSRRTLMYQSKNAPLEEGSDMFDDVREGQGESEVLNDELVDSDHMEGLCGATELFMPSKPARSSIRQLSASFELPSSVVRDTSFATASSYTKSIGDTNSVVSASTAHQSSEPRTEQTKSSSPKSNESSSFKAIECSALQAIESNAPKAVESSTPPSVKVDNPKVKAVDSSTPPSVKADNPKVKESDRSKSIETVDAKQARESQDATCDAPVESRPASPVESKAEDYILSAEKVPVVSLPVKPNVPMYPKTKIGSILKRGFLGRTKLPKETTTPSTLVTSLAPEDDMEHRTGEADLNENGPLDQDAKDLGATLRSDRSVEVFVVPNEPAPLQEAPRKKGKTRLKGLLAKTLPGEKNVNPVRVSREPLHHELAALDLLIHDVLTETDAATTTSRDTWSTSLAAGDAPEDDVLTFRRIATSKNIRPMTPDKSIIDGCKENPASATVCTEASTTTGYSSISPPSPLPMTALEHGSSQVLSAKEACSPSLSNIEYVPCDAADQESITAAVVAADEALASVPEKEEVSYVSKLEVVKSTIAMEHGSDQWKDDSDFSTENDFEVTLENYVLASEVDKDEVEEAKATSPQTPRSHNASKASSAYATTETPSVSPPSPPMILRKSTVPNQFSSEISKPYKSIEEAGAIDEALDPSLSRNAIDKSLRDGSLLTKTDPPAPYESKSMISLKHTESNESSSEASYTSGTATSVDTDDGSFRDEGSTHDTESESSFSVDEAELEELEEEDLDVYDDGDDDDITDNEMTDYDEDMSSAGTFRSLSSTKEAWCMFADDHCGTYDR